MSPVSASSRSTQDDLNAKLQAAAGAGMLDVMRELKALGADPHAGEERALRTAAENHQLNACKLLLEWGAHVDACKGHALFMAVYANSPEVVSLLLRAGAQTRIPGRRFPGADADQLGSIDNRVMLPREYAVKLGRTEIVAMLDAADRCRQLQQPGESSAPVVRGMRL